MSEFLTRILNQVFMLLLLWVGIYWAYGEVDPVTGACLVAIIVVVGNAEACLSRQIQELRHSIAQLRGDLE